MIIAVETADIVNSTSLNNVLFEKVDLVLGQELEEHKMSCKTAFERYRGDAYQVTYNEPEHAIRCALMTRLRLHFDIFDKPVHLTQSIAMGVQSADNKMGEVYIASGRQLDKLTRKDFAVTIESENDLMLATLFLNDVLNHLTQKQAEILYWYLKTEFTEHHHIASLLKTTRQNVSIHLSRAKADLIKAYIEAYQKAARDRV